MLNCLLFRLSNEIKTNEKLVFLIWNQVNNNDNNNNNNIVYANYNLKALSIFYFEKPL